MGNSQTLCSPCSNSKFYKYQTSKDFIYIHIPISSKSTELAPWLALKEYRKHIYSHACQFATEHYKNIQDGLCSDACTAIFRSIKCTDNLYDEIQRRKQIGRYYNHEQIWYMMNSIVKFAVSVHEKGWKWIIGNVHPKNIFINENGEVSVIALNSLPFEKDHYQTYKKEGFLSAFVSPELVGFTFSKDKNFLLFPDCVNKQISEAFTIGMTMLSMCTLQTNLTSLYDMSFYFNDPREKNKDKNMLTKKNKVYYVHDFGELLDMKLLNFQMNNIKSRYCGLLATIIKALLNPNPKQRLSLIYLHKQILEPNESFISDMETYWLGGENLTSLPQQSVDMTYSDMEQVQSHLY